MSKKNALFVTIANTNKTNTLMKISTLFTLFILLSFSSFSQSNTSRYAVPITPLTPVERYGVDYELKDHVFTNGDSTVLNLIDLTTFEDQRSQTENVEIIDTATGLTIVLFFEKKEKTTTTHLTQKL